LNIKINSENSDVYSALIIYGKYKYIRKYNSKRIQGDPVALPQIFLPLALSKYIIGLLNPELTIDVRVIKRFLQPLF
jgi:hypothetical protein